MNFKAWFKGRTADPVLSPLRKELVGLIGSGTTVLEVGCGTGDLLFQAAAKISEGHGVDIDRGMIRYAESKRKKHGLEKLSFECVDALAMAPRRVDVSTSTLCLHELPAREACALLRMMVENSEMALIADFSEAGSPLGRLSIEFDELLSGHYRNYRRYRRSGAIPAYVEEIGARVHKEIRSSVDGISIWHVSNDASAWQPHHAVRLAGNSGFAGRPAGRVSGEETA